MVLAWDGVWAFYGFGNSQSTNGVANALVIGNKLIAELCDVSASSGKDIIILCNSPKKHLPLWVDYVWSSFRQIRVGDIHGSEGQFFLRSKPLPKLRSHRDIEKTGLGIVCDRTLKGQMGSECAQEPSRSNAYVLKNQVSQPIVSLTRTVFYRIEPYADRLNVSALHSDKSKVCSVGLPPGFNPCFVGENSSNGSSRSSPYRKILRSSPCELLGGAMLFFCGIFIISVTAARWFFWGTLPLSIISMWYGLSLIFAFSE